MALHLIKLCVGVESVEDLERRIAGRGDPAAPTSHVTRQTPKRAAEILDGGSLYWVIRGVAQCRQSVVGLEPVEGEGVTKCRILLEPELRRTQPILRRPFQGWRYLEAAGAPPDLGASGEGGEDLPPHLQRELMEIGAW